MTGNSKYLLLALILALVALPLFIKSYYVLRLLTTTGMYLIIVGGLNVLQGYTGLVSIGQAGLYGFGAYAAGLLMKNLGLPFVPTLFAVMGIGAIVGLFLGVVCLKLKQAYLAIVTLAFGLIVQIVAVNWSSVTGGMEGLMGIPKPNIFGFLINTPAKGYYLVLVICVIVFFVIANLARSSWGRALKAVRDDEIAANIMGINVVSTKLFAFAFSSVLAMLSGTLYAGLYGGIFSDYFDMNLSVLFLSMMVIGGAGTQIGPVLGTALIALGLETLRFLGEGQMLVYGVIVVALCIFSPGGLAGLFAKKYLEFKNQPLAEGRGSK